MATWDLRPFTPADVEAYRALRLRCLAENETSFGTSPDEEAAKPLDAIRQSLVEDDATGFVMGAFVAGAPVGMMAIRREAKRKYAHKASLMGVYVVPEHRGSGLARALLDATLARARAIGGLEHVLLGVAVDNPAAVRLYEAVGFRTWGTEPRAIKHAHGHTDTFQMALDLR